MFLAMISRHMMGSESNIYAIESAINAIRGNLGGGTITNSHTEVSNRLVNATKASLIEMANSLPKSGSSVVVGNGPDDANTSVPGSSSSGSNTLSAGTPNPLTLSPESLPGTPSFEPLTPLSHNAQHGVSGMGGAAHPGSILLQHKKLSQYNIDEDDDNDVTSKQHAYDEQLWHVLDMANLKLSCISERLTSYTFLNRLYLNGNKISVIPKSIKNLKKLRVLDLSNNNISMLPAELGMLFNLKYLYLFDNKVKNFPYEFGNLISLQFLGFEGNPIDPELLKIYMDKGLTGLLFYLRDNAPEVKLVNQRQIVEIDADGEMTGNEYPSLTEAVQNQPLGPNSFSLVTYNTLCQHYATPKMYRYTPSWALSWSYRRDKLQKEILGFNTDIICLQEVETKTYEDFWLPLLSKQGYAGVFHSKTRSKTMQLKDSKKVDGCCIFYKESEFKPVFYEHQDFSTLWMTNRNFLKTEDFFNRAMSKDNVVIYLKLQHLKTNEIVWIVTTHLHWDPRLNDVKAFQTAILLDHLEKLVKEQSHLTREDQYKKEPIIICGDFNSQRHSAVYELFSKGNVQKDHIDLHGRDYGHLTKNNFAHNFQFQSAYNCVGELNFTNFTPTFTDVIDYIWYSPDVLRVRDVLGDIDSNYTSHFIGFPNADFPSDHIPMLSRFEFTKNKADNVSSRSRKV